MAGTWSSWHREPDDDIEALPYVRRRVRQFAEIFRSESVTALVILVLVAGYCVVAVLGSTCPVLAIQLLAINAGMLLAYALSLLNYGISCLFFAVLHIMTLVQVFVAHPGALQERDEHQTTPPPPEYCLASKTWPTFNVVLGGSFSIWTCYEIFSDAFRKREKYEPRRPAALQSVNVDA